LATNTRNITVSKDEYALFGKALPYIAMAIGAGLLFLMGIFLRGGIYMQNKTGEVPFEESTKIVTWAVLIVGTILCAIAWKLFSQRRGLFIAPHATITTAFAHIWLIIALWEDMGDFIFGAVTFNVYVIGASAIIISWCIRRWAFRDDFGAENAGENPFEAIGLGDARIDKANSKAIPSGHKFRLKLPLGKTIEDALKNRAEIAAIAGKPRELVHVTETEDGVEGQVDVTILKADPFGSRTNWQGPDYPGDSIVSPITFATYDIGTRPELYIAGKNGASSQHFLTMGMSGSGKSKAWQVIYGTVLNRKDVSVIYADPAKGMQTGGPLAAGLEWFATTEDGCMEMIEAVMRAIPARTDYLTSKGLDHWVRGCGLNFIIFHLEEAARFAKVDDLIELIEAARSAGISIVVSLQRATNDRLKTSARYNLGANMCFGVKMKTDARFGLSEAAIDAGAQPHLWQDRFPGRFYLEAAGQDFKLAGHPLQTDWIDTRRLEQEVDAGYTIRTPLDDTTADALGPAYRAYRQAVAEGTTNWQELRRNRGHDGNTWEMGSTIPSTAENSTQEELPFNVEVVEDSKEKTVARVYGFQTPVEETQARRQHLTDIIDDFERNGKMEFSPADIKAAGFEGRSNAWITGELKKLVKNGRLTGGSQSGFYRIIQ
jgi:hypothetical protein